MSRVELVIDAKAILGEGPSWDSKKGILYWVDIIGKKVHLFHPMSGESRVIPVGQMVGAVVPRDSGGVMLAMEDGFYACNTEAETLEKHGDPGSVGSHMRFNDGKCDAAGRFWAGTMDRSELEPMGALFVLDPHQGVRKMVDRVTVSNGITWNKEHTTMYYIDSPTRRVDAFDFDLHSGAISRRRTVVRIPEGEGLPDGMTMDEEGMLWIAHWDGYQVSRWNPATGEKLEKVPLPVARVTSCVFAGEQLNELYITTARIGIDSNKLENQPYAGGLFKIKTAVRGVPTYGYSG
ncbi:SMP-30/gluconolactonase/LRE family protein [Ammoniphilus sp. YIM 78166]|uniref:SMP-30/gluconolactonase/LRE family protein n=1 Tax=Ammoniphilus sp. YIM 78166 TaxID=1644106 RepID=UPI0010704D22|nr:SMP-30/gluconolactonase/LRE family protein [Ammoniphilus sp. YIM 78166]